MTQKKALILRREQVSICLGKSLTTPSAIFKQLQLNEKWTHVTLEQVKHDLRWMRKESRVWLTGHALEGYVFSTQITLEQLRDIELELQSMRTKTNDITEKLSIIHELKDTLNLRWQMEGEGRTLLALQYKDNDGT